MANIKIRKCLFHDQKRGKAEDLKMAVKLSSYPGPGKCVTEMRVIKRTLLIPPGRELGNRATEPGFKKIFLVRQILQYLDILLLVNLEKL